MHNSCDTDKNKKKNNPLPLPVAGTTGETSRILLNYRFLQKTDWYTGNYEKEAKSSNVNQYQFWRHDNKPIELWSNKVIEEEINYVYYNPVEEGLVYFPQDYIYSSTRDYAGEKGLIDGVIVVT